MGAELVIFTASALTAIGVPTAIGTTIAVFSPYILAAAAVAGSLWLSAALTPKPAVADAAKTAKTSRSLIGASRFWVYGKAKLGGNIVFVAAKGNTYSLITAHCEGEIDGIEEVQILNKRCALDSSGRVMTSPYWRNASNSWATIQTKSGAASQTVFSTTNASYSGQWESTCRGDGICMSEGTFDSPGADDQDHQRIYPVGYPDVQLIVRGPAIFNPLLGLDPEDSGNWEWTDNGPANLLGFMTRPRNLGGMEIPWAYFDLADIAETVAAGDAEVETLDGTEPRSRCWGVQDLGPNVKFIDTFDALRASTGCDVYFTQEGLLTIRFLEDQPEATVAINWRDIVAFEITDGPDTGSRKNKWQLRCFLESSGWEVVDLDVSAVGWALDQNSIDDIGEQVGTIDLAYCPSAAQASRIGRRVAALQNAATGAVRTNLSGLATMGHAIASIEVADLDETLTAVIASPRLDGLNADAPVSLTFSVMPVLAPFDPQDHEASPPAEIVEIPDGNAANPPTITHYAVVKTGFAAGNVKYAIRCRLTYTDGDEDNQQFIARPITGRKRDQWIVNVRAESILSGSGVVFLQIPPQTTRPDGFEIRAASSKDFYDISAWTDPVDVMFTPSAAPAAPTVSPVDNGDGTWTYNFDGLIQTSYFIVTTSAGVQTVVDAAEDGGASLTSSPIVGSVRAYTWDDVPSLPTSF